MGSEMARKSQPPISALTCLAGDIFLGHRVGDSMGPGPFSSHTKLPASGLSH